MNQAPFDVTVICTLYHGTYQHVQANRPPLRVTVRLFFYGITRASNKLTDKATHSCALQIHSLERA